MLKKLMMFAGLLGGSVLFSGGRWRQRIGGVYA